MSNAEYFGVFKYFHEHDQHWRDWHVWAELDPASGEVFFVFSANTDMFGRPEKGYPPSQCTVGHWKRALEHVIKTIVTSSEVVDSEDFEVIDDNDPGSPTITRLL